MATVMEQTALDPQKLEQFVFRAVDEVGAALNAALVVMGDKLGLYRALADAGWLTPAELATRTDTAERYVREWLNAQAAGGYVDYDPETRSVHPAAGAGGRPHGRVEPRLSAGLLPDRGWVGARLAADHGGGADGRRVRLARARARRPRGLRAVLPARLQREPDRRVAAGARRRRREARARRSRRRRRLRPRRVDDPDGAGVPAVDVRRLRLPRGLDRDRTRAGADGGAGRPRPLRDGSRRDASRARTTTS